METAKKKLKLASTSQKKKKKNTKKSLGGIMENILTFITQAPVRNHKIQADLGRQTRDHGPDVPGVDRGN